MRLILTHALLYVILIISVWFISAFISFILWKPLTNLAVKLIQFITHNKKENVPIKDEGITDITNTIKPEKLSLISEQTQTIEINGTEYAHEQSQQYSYIRLIMLFVVCFINFTVFVDKYYIYKQHGNTKYFKDFVQTILSVVGVHLTIEHVLQNIINSFIPAIRTNMRLYSTTACIRDIINNIIMTLFYLFVMDSFEYWWVCIMYGCYFADLIMLLSKWNFVTKKWLGFVFIHHLCVCMFVLLLNHTTKIYINEILLSIIIYMNSNTIGCFCIIWKSFKLPFEKYSKIVCFVIQRIIRIVSYVLGFYQIKLAFFFQSDYLYIVIVIFGVVLDIWDIYNQSISIYKQIPKKKRIYL